MPGRPTSEPKGVQDVERLRHRPREAHLGRSDTGSDTLVLLGSYRNHLSRLSDASNSATLRADVGANS